MKKIRTALWFLLIGSGVSLAAGLLVFFVFPQSWASFAYMWAGLPIALLLSSIIPTEAIYWLVPDGGGGAFILLLLLGAFVSWAIFFATLALLVRRAW